MNNAVEVGQVWREKDKRRDRVIEVIAVGTEAADGLVVGTEKVTTLKIERLVKRWELIETKTTEVFEEADRLGNITEHTVELTESADGKRGSVKKVIDKELEAVLTSKLGVEHNATKRVVGGRNYHLLVECPVNGEDGQRFRTTQKQFDSFGAPLCGCHHKAMNLIEQH